MFFGLAKKVENLLSNQLVSPKRKLENDRAMADIEEKIQKTYLQQFFRRQSTVLNFTMKG